MRSLLKKITDGKKVLILGFGREGKSTCRILRNYFPKIRLFIADRNPYPDFTDFEKTNLDQFFLGENYLDALRMADVVFKSPGVKLDESTDKLIVSQSLLFLEKYHGQIIGITGTKGKSTTTSIIYHLLQKAGKNTVMVGNIGIPPFDAIHRITRETIIVFEISAHQLEFIHHSPHIAVLLNIFQEHTDYFGTFESYAKTKLNIARYQQKKDFLIFDGQHGYLKEKLSDCNCAGIKIPVELPMKNQLSGPVFLQIPFTNQSLSIDHIKLNGHHNLKNILTAVTACSLTGISVSEMEKGLIDFNPLEHRLENCGTIAEITFFNDSISTIPESTIEAVKTLPDTDTIILGGFDRGIDYTGLIEFLSASSIRCFIFTGPAGNRMMTLMLKKQHSQKHILWMDDWKRLPELILENTRKGKICLLSPAASSYDRFKNFEERGRFFKQTVTSIAATTKQPE